MHLFYISNIYGSEITLAETESKHAVRVLRLKEGSSLNIVDGRGGFYSAELTEANPKKCRLAVKSIRKEFGKRNFTIHIAIAPTKNIARFEWFLEKATEIGIDEITPLITQHSERKNINADRLQKILISAMKQSQKAYLPKLNELISFNNFMDRLPGKEKFIAHCNGENKTHLKNKLKKGSDSLVLIGPEGDFSDNEIIKALSVGFREISLGSSRLRTETAGVVACHIAALVNE